jgi:hypothetical protein
MPTSEALEGEGAPSGLDRDPFHFLHFLDAAMPQRPFSLPTPLFFEHRTPDVGNCRPEQKTSPAK